MEECEALVALTTAPQLGNSRCRRLIEHFGSAAAALSAAPHEVSGVDGFTAALASGLAAWHTAGHWRRELLLLRELSAEIVPYTAANYPAHLHALADAPLLLYVRGMLLPADRRSVAIVGTRNATPYGSQQAANLARVLASHGITVVSGLARGIDTAAHTAALSVGRTLAVLGSGLAHIYPRENEALARAIAEGGATSGPATSGPATSGGALLSAFPLSTPPDRHLFPLRNRIVSGMTRATILIEAPSKSGAMITARQALEQKKPLFALPGRVDNENFRGNHQLIKEGNARLLENPEEVLALFDDLFLGSAAPAKGGGAAENIASLSSQEKQILAALRQEESSLETLSSATRLPPDLLQSSLMELLLKRLVKELPGKIYQSTIHG